ncbi:hypothetical protein ACFSQ7_20940 [Paenibacillus rhizoplanae]
MIGGVVDGLKVTMRDGITVEIAPGFALNRVTDPEHNEEISQEIMVSDAHPDRVINLSGYSTSDQIYISISYKEKADGYRSAQGRRQPHPCAGAGEH